MADALKSVPSECFGQSLAKLALKEKFLNEKNLILCRTNSKYPLPTAVASTIKVVIIEFAGTKFKTQAISGLEYIKSVEQYNLQPIICMIPKVGHIVLVEEKYSFTPDNFKAATRDQKNAKSDASIHHLKTGRELLSAEKFSKTA